MQLKGFASRWDWTARRDSNRQQNSFLHESREAPLFASGAIVISYRGFAGFEGVQLIGRFVWTSLSLAWHGCRGLWLCRLHFLFIWLPICKNRASYGDCLLLSRSHVFSLSSSPIFLTLRLISC